MIKDWAAGASLPEARWQLARAVRRHAGHKRKGSWIARAKKTLEDEWYKKQDEGQLKTTVGLANAEHKVIAAEQYS